MSIILRVFLVSVFLLTLGSSCTSTNRTVRNETVTVPPSTAYPAGATTEYQSTTTTTTETVDPGAHGGVLSSTVNGVGEVIALPFRAVGALVRFVF